ncbi:phenylalanine 4-monooxygenase [Bacterioplanes sanyensis]|uniref:phenylalanine 4-monooxygenase n=1 Tax=Bacterioplanes sanyensis TaxID=1249553 RepID=UPI001678A4EE|nr:phenylalanine 4-monooxygenase [Bacterioplanes sanyensis]GGY54570.1 phenylalanine 4-monooxygenase [Bacterioplanes sanyensis]
MGSTAHDIVIEAVPGSKYTAKEPDANGLIHYTAEEDAVWKDLIERQQIAIQGVACQEFVHGMELLKLPQERIPQLTEVSEPLAYATGWSAAAVPALIPFITFCHLLANKRFPCATFIRAREELDYLEEPDIFHEVFGHCAMLTNPSFAAFTEAYGKLGLEANDAQRKFLERLYWFTVEFGLLKTPEGMRVYGGGILSSIGETQYACSDTPDLRPFNVLDVLRTPYRIDIMQPIYYVLESIDDLFKVAHMDLFTEMKKAEQLGMFEPEFPPKA